MKSISTGRRIPTCSGGKPNVSSIIKILLFLLLGVVRPAFAQPSPGPNPNQLLDSWSFSDTNWLSARGYPPVTFTNLVSVANSGDGNSIFLDTTNSTPAYLFYNLVEDDGFTNFSITNGSILLWFNPNWTSTNQGGTGPGDWGNLISLGQAGTNGTSWWSWYLDPGGSTIYFSSQTNGGTSSNYLTAPVSFLSNHWYNLVLSYSRTNSAVYTNGVLLTNGAGITHWPGADISFFAVGSDTNGSYQAGGKFDDLSTYNYPVDPILVAGTFSMYSLIYHLSAPSQTGFSPAPSTPSVVPTFDAVTGFGYLQTNGGSPASITNSKVWMTNTTATVTTIGTNTIVNYSFYIAGGSNGFNYDVFFSPVLQMPLTNGTWYWMGQGPHGLTYTISVTNQPSNFAGFFLLGTPQDADGDGLTDAYELLVSRTDPHKADTDGDGMLDGWEVVYGTNPLADDSASSAQRSNFLYDPVGRLQTVMGIRSETITDDFEGNVLSSY